MSTTTLLAEDALLEQVAEAGAINLDKIVTSGDWPDPAPLPEALPPVPAFNFDCLPNKLRPWLEDIADRMQCPPDFPAVAAMVAQSSIVGCKICIRPKRVDDWKIVPNLWGAIIGRPGQMKTPAAEQALLPLRRLAAESLERYDVAVKAHKVTALLETQKVKIAEVNIKTALKTGDNNAARAEAETVLKKGASKPVCRRYETNDPTIEKLGELLAENPNGLLLFRDELVGLLRGLDREGHESDRANYLEMWTGSGTFTSDRIGRGTVRAPSIISILGGIQPDLFISYIREAVRGGAGADGLLHAEGVLPAQWRRRGRGAVPLSKPDGRVPQGRSPIATLFPMPTRLQGRCFGRQCE